MANNKNQTPIEKFPRLQKKFEMLKKQHQTHLDVGLKMLSVDNGKFYVTDIVIIGVLKRSLDLIDGITSLVERWNFSAAAPLLRLQLDSLLRLVYLATLKNADTVSADIINGHSFGNLKDKEGKKLTDVRLRDYARTVYPWIDDVYKETSKLIHFSEKHCFQPFHCQDEQSRKLEIIIGEGFPNWLEADIDSLLDAMGCITDALLKVVIGWINNKLHTQDNKE